MEVKRTIWLIKPEKGRIIITAAQGQYSQNQIFETVCSNGNQVEKIGPEEKKIIETALTKALKALRD